MTNRKGVPCIVTHGMFIDLIKELKSEEDTLTGNYARDTHVRREHLQVVVAAASVEPTSENLHRVALALYRTLNGYISHPYGLSKDTWNYSVVKMKILAEKAASSKNASGEACHLAGAIANTEWGYFSWCLLSGNTPQAKRYLTGLKGDRLLDADGEAAHKWFKKGARKGNPACTELAKWFVDGNHRAPPRPMPGQ